MKEGSRLLIADGVANLLFGIALLAFPKPFFEALGLPWTNHGLYPTILGGVLVGIGVALLKESRSTSGGTKGLGLWGAVAINLAAGLTIAGWLIWSGDTVSGSGRVFLWFLVLFLFAISGGEVAARKRDSAAD